MPDASNRAAAPSSEGAVAAALPEETMPVNTGAVGAVIESVESERLSHMVAGNLGGFAEVCDERLDYVHSTGRRDTLGSLLEMLESGAVTYKSIRHNFSRIESLGKAVWTMGSMQIILVKDGQAKQLQTLTTTLWVRHHDSYRLLSFHATALPVMQN
jgi:hypothetical protein